MPQKITQTERNAIEVELTENEIELLTDAPEEPIRKIAIGLMAKCGLRVGETVRVSPDDIISSSGGNPYIQVESRGKTREVPLPHGLHTDIRDYVDEHQTGSTESIVDRSERTVSRWVKEAAEE